MHRNTTDGTVAVSVHFLFGPMLSAIKEDENGILSIALIEKSEKYMNSNKTL